MSLEQNTAEEPEIKENLSSEAQLKKLKIQNYNRLYRERHPERVKAANREAARKYRNRGREKLVTGKSRTKWNVEAAKPQGIYIVPTINDANALRGALLRLGFFVRFFRTNQGYKVYKLKVAYE